VYERAEVEAFAQRKDREAAEALAQNPTPLRPPSEPAEAITLVPDPDPEPEVTAPPPPPVVRPVPGPVAPPPRGAPPPAPVTSPAAFAGTVAMPRPPATGFGGTVVLPPPGALPARAEAPKASAESPKPAEEKLVEPPFSAPAEAPKQAQPDAVVEPPKVDVPAAAVAQPEPSPFSPYGKPSVVETSRGFKAQKPPVDSLPRVTQPADVHEEVPVPSDALGEKPARRSSALLVVIGLVALGLGVGGGALFLQRSKAKSAAEPRPTAAAVATPNVPATDLTNVPPPPRSAAPVASDEAPPSGSASAAAEPEASPEASSSASKATSAELSAPSVPAIPAPDFDLEKLPGDRAALLVRSSTQARVFVHGKDYGETNRSLLTTCGIRFVRLGRGFNDFIEPGRSIVVKCGRLTEVSIEPDR
jgi:hypothetical protein